MQDTYWNHNGKYEAEATALNALVPGMGAADTFKGEVWRAASKIYYDYYNNGWGNFWKAPAAFLMTHIDLDKDLRNMLFEHANGNMHAGDYQDEMELLITVTVEQLRAVEDRPNDVDMWDFEGSYEIDSGFWDEQVYDDEDDYEEDYEEDFCE